MTSKTSITGPVTAGLRRPDPLLAGLNHELACMVPHPARVKASGAMETLSEALGYHAWLSFVEMANDPNLQILDVAKRIAAHPRYRLLVENEVDPDSLACLAAVWLAFCQRGNQVVVTRDALDWTLLQSDLDASLRAESFAFNERGLYLQISEYPGFEEDSPNAFVIPGRGIIEGVYMFSTTRENCRHLEFVLSLRGDAAGVLSTLMFESIKITDESAPLADILHPLVTTLGPRGTGLQMLVFEHLAKVMLYAASGPTVEKEVLPENPTVEDVEPFLLNRPYPVTLLGPASLSRLRLDINTPAEGVARWKRGVFKRIMRYGIPCLSWDPPHMTAS